MNQSNAVETNIIHTGDAISVLDDMPAKSVHCVICSPPYYGLRDYGDDVDTIFGGDRNCTHDWTVQHTPTQGGNNTSDNPPDVGGNKATQKTRLRGGDGIQSRKCDNCGAWHGQLGLEPTLDQYIDNITAVGEEIDRVLRDDGVWWLNLGDSFAGSGRGAWDKGEEKSKESFNFKGGEAPERNTHLKQKNKMLVPYRVAIALQEDGWIVRNDAIWRKNNPMPHPVSDRLNTTTERFFLLAKEPQYYFDLDAIREPYTSTVGDTENTTNTDSDNLHPDGKNPGDVFEVSTKPFPDAHFAVYPPELIRKPIKSSCPETVCSDCGTPYERAVEREADEYNYSERGDTVGKGHQASGEMIAPPDATHTGWTKVCECDTENTESGIVLDPFIGAGTTALVAREHQRQFIGIELNPEYADMARSRVGLSVHNPESRRMDTQTGFDQFAE